MFIITHPSIVIFMHKSKKTQNELKVESRSLFLDLIIFKLNQLLNQRKSPPYYTTLHLHVVKTQFLN